LVPPDWLTFRKLGGSGRPKATSKLCRSLVAKFGLVLLTNFGLSKALTMAIVWPVPSPTIEPKVIPSNP
jgi:hypothetical protein